VPANKDAVQSDRVIERVDALLRRGDAPGAHETDVPVLTEVLEEESGRQARAFDAGALEALARELERAVLERLGPEVDRVIEEKLARTLTAVLGQALDGVRSELTGSVTQMVREAVAASVAHALGQTKAK
jgi:PleD family two-component response regulator